MNTLQMNVKSIRAAGLDAKWGRTRNGGPAMFVRNPNATREYQRVKWWMVTQGMWADMLKLGAVEAFDNHTLLGDVFSIPA